MLNIFIVIIFLFISLMTCFFIKARDVFTKLLILNSCTSIITLLICFCGSYIANSSYLDIALIYFLLSFIASSGYLKYFIYQSKEAKK